MADKIYGIHQSQPRDLYDYMKANARPLGLEGRFSYLPVLREKAQTDNIIGLVNGIEMIVSDEVLFDDEVLMDGRTRRYQKVQIFMGAFGQFTRIPAIIDIEDEMRQLGYTDLTVIKTYEVATEYSADLGVDPNNPYFNPLLFNAADLVEIKAGVPRYLNAQSNIADAPFDGREYVRIDGEWVVSDHFVHASIDGGTATI